MPSDGRKLSMEELYSAALALTGQQRADYIQSHCADPAEREQLLRRLSDATKTQVGHGNPESIRPLRLSPARGWDITGSSALSAREAWASSTRRWTKT